MDWGRAVYRRGGGPGVDTVLRGPGYRERKNGGQGKPVRRMEGKRRRAR